MKQQIQTTFKSLIAATVAVLAIVAIGQPVAASAKGSAGGGKSGGTKVVESRVTGYATALDYSKSTIYVGASYYGSGQLIVTADTSISMDNVSCSLEEIEVGDWVEARYVRVFDASTGLYVNVATKLSVTSFVSP